MVNHLRSNTKIYPTFQTQLIAEKCSEILKLVKKTKCLLKQQLIREYLFIRFLLVFAHITGTSKRNIMAPFRYA